MSSDEAVKYSSSYLRQQRGVALITVLMVFAIASLIATKVLTQKALDTQRIAGMINRTQAHYYALAAEELAMLALKHDLEEDQKSGNPIVDTLEEPWAGAAIPFEIDNIGNVVIKIVDLNRFYNLNNMLQPDGKVNETELERFRNLLEELDIDPSLAENVQDWLDKDDKTDGFDSESDSYERLEIPYLAANRGFSDVSELRMIAGFSAEMVDRLLPHVTALTGVAVLPININTATTYALTTLQKSSGSGAQGVGLVEAQNIESARPYENIADVHGRAGSNIITDSTVNPASGGAAGYALSRLRYDSQYYEVIIRANYAGSIAYLTSTIKHSGANFVVLSRRETDNSIRFAQ
jgi:general secretion pathway protein K